MYRIVYYGSELEEFVPEITEQTLKNTAVICMFNLEIVDIFNSDEQLVYTINRNGNCFDYINHQEYSIIERKLTII